MPQLLTIPVSDGNKIHCVVDGPLLESGKKPSGWLLFCRGFVYDPKKEAEGVHSRHNGVMSVLERILRDTYGFGIVSVAPTSYESSGFHGPLTLERFVADNAAIIESLEREIGQSLGVVGHSFGGYVGVKLASLKRGNGEPLVTNVALVNVPFSPHEAIGRLRGVYTLLPGLSARVGLGIVNVQVRLAYNGRVNGGLKSLANAVTGRLTGRLGDVDVGSYASALVQDTLAAPAADAACSLTGARLLIIYGSKDPILFRGHNLFSVRVAWRQTSEEYENRWRGTDTAHLEIVSLPVGHNLKPGTAQRLKDKLHGHEPPDYALAIADRLGSHFSMAYAVK